MVEKVVDVLKSVIEPNPDNTTVGWTNMYVKNVKKLVNIMFKIKISKKGVNYNKTNMWP